MSDELLKQDQDTADLETLRNEREEYLAGWKRAQADYANLQKETEKARKDFMKYGMEECLLRLLPAIDQFEVALQFQPSLDAVPDDKRRPFENWVTGLHAVKTLWEDAAKDLGLEKISASGDLNPVEHDAVTEEPSDTVPEGKIIRVTQNGWKLNQKLIRPAKVVVSKGPNS